MMEKVAQSSGCVLWKNGNRIYAVKNNSGSLAIAIFVFLLLSVIFTLNGIVFFILSVTGKMDSPKAGIILTAFGAGFIFMSVKLIKTRKKINNRLPDMNHSLCIFDTGNRKIYDRFEKETGNFSQARLERKFQMTSSSKKLVLVCNGEEITLAKGNPFDGGVDAVENYLKKILQ